MHSCDGFLGALCVSAGVGFLSAVQQFTGLRFAEIGSYPCVSYTIRYGRRRIRSIVTENEIGAIVVAAAIAVHRKLGPGLLETVYEAVLTHELQQRGLETARQVPVPITYEGTAFDEGFRADMIVEGLVVLELKSVERLAPVHAKQVQTYLRLTGRRLGYLLNFGQALMKDGIVRCVNGLPE